MLKRTLILSPAVTGTGRPLNIPLPPGSVIIQVRPMDTPEARFNRRMKFMRGSCRKSNQICSGGLCSCATKRR